LALHAQHPLPAQQGQQVEQPGHPKEAVGQKEDVLAQDRGQQRLQVLQQRVHLGPVLPAG
jgi:hypothetical protein